MTNPFLNRVFYGVDKTKVNSDFIATLNSLHALTKSKKENALKFIEQTRSTPEPVIQHVAVEKSAAEVHKPVPSKQTIYPTSATNTIFWAVYIAVYGLADYQFLGASKERKRELEEKQKILEVFEKNQKLLKHGGGYKLTNVEIAEYKSDLLLEKDRLRSLVGYSAFYKINIIVLFKEKNAYLSFSYTVPTIVSDDYSSPTIPTIVLEYCPKTRVYGLNVEFDTDYDLLRVRPWNSRASLDEVLQKMFQMDHYEKPLKAIGNYKVVNLEDIARLVAVDVSAMKKPDMYQAIYSKLVEN